MTERVVGFIDGFNLYHSLKNLGKPHLKWVSLWDLMNTFVKPRSQSLEAVYYFSAYAHWLPPQEGRHREYVHALIATGVTPVMASFKAKDRKCPKCRHTWKGHEEKETDVNIAIAMLNGAYEDEFDRALLLTRDSDLAPAVAMIGRQFPKKGVTIIAPPNRGHSNELLQAGPSVEKAKIKLRHIEACLLPAVVRDVGGNVAARRPSDYDPSP